MLFLDSACMITDTRNTTKTKVLNERNLQKLCENLQAKTFDLVYCCNDLDSAYDYLLKDITDSIESTIPDKIVKCRTIDCNPWLTKGILKSINLKNKLYRQYIKNPSNTNREKYIKYRNKLTHIMRLSKRNHYTKLIKVSHGDSKKSWQVLNKVLNRGQKNTVLPDMDDLVNNFNNYFTSVGENLSKLCFV